MARWTVAPHQLTRDPRILAVSLEVRRVDSEGYRPSSRGDSRYETSCVVLQASLMHSLSPATLAKWT